MTHVTCSRDEKRATTHVRISRRRVRSGDRYCAADANVASYLGRDVSTAAGDRHGFLERQISSGARALSVRREKLPAESSGWAAAHSMASESRKNDEHDREAYASCNAV